MLEQIVDEFFKNLHDGIFRFVFVLKVFETQTQHKVRVTFVENSYKRFIDRLPVFSYKVGIAVLVIFFEV